MIQLRIVAYVEDPDGIPTKVGQQVLLDEELFSRDPMQTLHGEEQRSADAQVLLMFHRLQRRAADVQRGTDA